MARKANHNQFKALNVQILGIAAQSPFSQKTFADSLGLPYPLLSDAPEEKTIKRYRGLELEQLRFVSRYFLVDRKGIIRGRWTRARGDVFPSKPILETARRIPDKS